MEDQRLPLNQMRASDSERELTVEHLTVAFVEGRLDHDEYDRRVGRALGAVLVGDLRSLTADLPPPEDSGRTREARREHRSGTPAPAFGAPWHEWSDEWRWWMGVTVVLTGVWGIICLMGGELVPYWPLVPLGIWASVLLASAIWPSEEEPP